MLALANTSNNLWCLHLDFASRVSNIGTESSPLFLLVRFMELRYDTELFFRWNTQKHGYVTVIIIPLNISNHFAQDCSCLLCLLPLVQTWLRYILGLLLFVFCVPDACFESLHNKVRKISTLACTQTNPQADSFLSPDLLNSRVWPVPETTWRPVSVERMSAIIIIIIIIYITILIIIVIINCDVNVSVFYQRALLMFGGRSVCVVGGRWRWRI